MRLLISLCAVFALSQTTVFAGSIQKTYFWEYEGKRYRFTYTFDKQDYDFYKGVKRDYYDFSFYMKEDPAYPVIDRLARKLQLLAQSYRLNDRETVEFIASFVQHFNYRGDGKYEYPRFPVETLVEQGGDCEDTAVLLAALLRSLGYEAILLSPEGHMGVGLAVQGEIKGIGVSHDGLTYYYIETTNTGWGIGDYPDHLSSEIKIYDPGSVPGAHPLALESSPHPAGPATVSKQHEIVAVTSDHTATQGNYWEDKELVGTQTGALSSDVMIIDGRKETAITYQDGNLVKVVSRQ